MTKLSRDLNLFGLDFGRVLPELKSAAALVFGGSWSSWLRPEVRVWVWVSDGEGLKGQVWQCSGNSWRAQPTTQSSTQPNGVRFQALSLTEDLFLTRRLSLPELSHAALHSAVALEARSQSPFSPDDRLWAYRIDPKGAAGIVAILVLASAEQVRRQVTKAGRSTDTTEVWAVPDNGTPIVFSGFGESWRLRFVARRRALGAGLLLVAVLIGGVIALTPTLKLRQQAIDAVHAHDAVVGRASPALQAREHFLAQAQRRDELVALRDGRLDPTRLIDVLTRELADDTHLTRIQVDGRKVAIQGQTSNAAALMQKLSDLPDISEVKAPGGATRGREAGTERFNIEFLMDARAFALKAETVAEATSAASATVEPVVPPAAAKGAPR